MAHLRTENIYSCDVCGATTRTVYLGPSDCGGPGHEELTERQKAWMQFDVNGLGGWRSRYAEGVVCSRACALKYVGSVELKAPERDGDV